MKAFSPLRHPEAKTASFARWWASAMHNTWSLAPGAWRAIGEETWTAVTGLLYALAALLVYPVALILSPLLSVFRAIQKRRVYRKNAHLFTDQS